MEARFTEYFSEYLENNSLPAAFDQIEGLADAFVARFCDKEIGFETETLFKIKFDACAARKIPLYAARIIELNAAVTAANDPTKSRKTTFDKGKATAKNWELPLTGTPETTTPKTYGTAESAQDVTLNEEKGVTVDEAMRRVDWYRKAVYDVFEEIFKEFEPLFLQIYF